MLSFLLWLNFNYLPKKINSIGRTFSYSKFIKSNVTIARNGKDMVLTMFIAGKK